MKGGAYPIAVRALESRQALMRPIVPVATTPESLNFCKNWVTNERITLYGEVISASDNFLLLVSQLVGGEKQQMPPYAPSVCV
jgi:hypothetical protein